MAERTTIEWAANADGTPGATWNPIRARDTVTGKTGTFCVHASDGCKHCYAETFQQRGLPNNGIGLAYTAPNLARVEHFLDDRMLAIPLRRRKPTTYFLSSMTDVFAEWVPDDMLDRLFAVMALCPQHTFIVLTKRAERMRAYFQRPDLIERRCDEIAVLAKVPFRLQGLIDPKGITLPNVWLVVSVEDQRNADERIPHLLATPAAIRGVSCEPLLGAINLDMLRLFGGLAVYNAFHGGSIDGTYCKPIDWVICGGESGPNARPMHPAWARSLRDQCTAASVPFFFKQWGEHMPALGTGERQTMVAHSGHIAHRIADMREGEGFYAPMMRVGKARAGRLLDGVEHNGRPPL